MLRCGYLGTRFFFTGLLRIRENYLTWFDNCRTLRTTPDEEASNIPQGQYGTSQVGTRPSPLEQCKLNPEQAGRSLIALDHFRPVCTGPIAMGVCPLETFHTVLVRYEKLLHRASSLESDSCQTRSDSSHGCGGDL